MADKRIKDLAATASSPSGDDFIVIDGAANGTRRIDAEVFALDENVPLFPTLVYDGTNGATEFLYGDIPSSWKINNTDITQLYIGNSATSIGDQAFSGCSYLTGDIIIPNSVTTIGNNAFRDCSGFTGDLIIGTGVNSIGSYAFYYTGFVRTIIADGRTTIPDNFATSSKIQGELVIPESVVFIGSYAFYYNNEISGQLNLPSGLTSISDYCFGICRNIAGSLTIPSGVTSIGSSAFRYCSAITSLTIPDSVVLIKNKAFDTCSGITNDLVLRNEATLIEIEAFRDCTGLTSAYLNQPIGQINSLAFSGSGITNVYIGPDATGYTLGSGQTIGGKSGITVSVWTNYPNVP